MILFPNAKINIGLRITDKLPTGYHEIRSVMVPVDWCDILEIVPSASNVAPCRLFVTGNKVDCPVEKNLVWRACSLMHKQFNLPPVDIYLHKIIPDGAGLGGGSSDAAFTISGLNRLFSLSLSEESMAQIAAQLGADCPFFIYNKPMIASGTGTTLNEISHSILSNYSIVIVKPQGSVSTAQAYSGVTPKSLTEDESRNLKKVLSVIPGEWQQIGIVNDFEPTVIPLIKDITAIKTALYECGALYSSMSGSGSAVYGIFSNRKQAAQAGRKLSDYSVHVGKFL